MFFQCEEDCGLFIGLDKIHPIAQASRSAAHSYRQGHPGSLHSGITVEHPPAVEVVKKGDQVEKVMRSGTHHRMP